MAAEAHVSLYLDIWIPPNITAESALPVKVWIYGGSQQAGSISDPLYSGCNLAMAETVVVSINYRLGPLGFLALESAGIDGNFGIQDLLLGLQWVQDHITNFGGDPVSSPYLLSTTPGSANPFCDLGEGTFVRTISWSCKHIHDQHSGPSEKSGPRSDLRIWWRERFAHEIQRQRHWSNFCKKARLQQ